MDEFDWRPDAVQRPDYPPPERPEAYVNTPEGRQQAAEWAHEKQRLLDMWERWHQPEGERPVWPAGLTPKARAELLRCAEAFEATAKRLRSIVGS
jgi:hypothetical protein